jgi:hypothetical protein
LLNDKLYIQNFTAVSTFVGYIPLKLLFQNIRIKNKGHFRVRWFSHLLENFKKSGESWQESEKERLWKERRVCRLFVH